MDQFMTRIFVINWTDMAVKSWKDSESVPVKDSSKKCES